MKLDFPQRSALQLLRSRTGKCRQLPVGRIRYRDHAITHNPGVGSVVAGTTVRP
jgi:hypothetical protein